MEGGSMSIVGELSDLTLFHDDTLCSTNEINPSKESVMQAIVAFNRMYENADPNQSRRG